MQTTTIKPPKTCQVFLQKGKTSYGRGAYEDALHCFNQILQINPSHFWAKLYRGETERQLGLLDEALADFDWILNQQPNHSWTLAHRGMVYKSLKDDHAAIHDLTNAIAYQPTYAWAIAQRGNLYAKNQRYLDALADMDRVIELNPHLITPWQGERGLLLNALGRYQETIDCCLPKAQQDEADFITRYSLVVAQTLLSASCQQAHIDKLENYLRQRLVPSTPLNPKQEAAIRYRLGGLLALQDNFQCAQSQLQAAILLDREFAEMIRHDPAWKQFCLEHYSHIY